MRGIGFDYRFNRIVFSFLIGWLILNVNTIICYSNGAEYSFSISDAAGDEEAIYPLSEEFRDKDGLFDILNFSVEANNDTTLEFTIEFVHLSNPRNGSLGFSYPVIEIYTHPSPPGSWRVGKDGATTKQAPSNMNSLIDDRYAWNSMVFFPIIYSFIQNNNI